MLVAGWFCAYHLCGLFLLAGYCGFVSWLSLVSVDNGRKAAIELEETVCDVVGVREVVVSQAVMKVKFSGRVSAKI